LIVFSQERKEAKKELWSWDYALPLLFIEISDCSIWRQQQH
jgi:hypothetical protein